MTEKMNEVRLAPTEPMLEARYRSMCPADMGSKQRFIYPKPLFSERVVIPESRKALRAADEIAKIQEESNKVSKWFEEQTMIHVEEFKKTVAALKLATGITDEDVIGCFLCNYWDRNVCSRFSNSYCKNLEKCTRLGKAVLK